MKLLLTVAAGLLVAAPAQAQQVSRQTSFWQVPSVCTVTGILINTQTKTNKEMFSLRCFGVAVTKAENLNVHFNDKHPSLGKPILTYVIAEGTFQGSHPVAQSVFRLDSPDQLIAQSTGGQCRAKVSQGESPMVQCGSAGPMQADGTYLYVVSTALFDGQLSPEIRSLLR